MSSYKKKPRPLSEAYREMLDTVRGAAVGESRQRLFAIKKAIKHGDYPKPETMREHLRRAGWTPVSDEMWSPTTKAPENRGLSR